MENSKEHNWLKALYKGEEQAYGSLFNEYFFALSSFANKFVENKEAAEDIAQEVLYQLWVNKQQFENVISLKSYLYRMVKNHCLNILKHQEVEKRYIIEKNSLEESDFFLEQILEEEVYLLLKEAVDLLPEPTRRIFELTLAGYDNQEIAEMTGLTLESVKTRKKRGKHMLQERLKNLIYVLMLFPEEI